MGNLRQLLLSTTVGNDEEEWDDEEFEEFQQLMGMAIGGVGDDDPPDIIDALHGVVREVTRYNPEDRRKSKKLPTIGFIQ